jgi:hypothetical protein
VGPNDKHRIAKAPGITTLLAIGMVIRHWAERWIANLRSEVAFGNDWQRPPKGVDIRRESKLARATRQFGRFPAKADEMSTNLHVKLPKMNRSCRFWAAHW